MSAANVLESLLDGWRVRHQLTRDEAMALIAAYMARSLEKAAPDHETMSPVWAVGFYPYDGKGYLAGPWPTIEAAMKFCPREYKESLAIYRIDPDKEEPTVEFLWDKARSLWVSPEGEGT